MGMMNVMAGGLGMVRSRVRSSLGMRGGGWNWGPGTQEKPYGYFLNRSPRKPGEKREWEGWEIPYIGTYILVTIMLVVGLNAKPDTTIETWAHKQAVQRLRIMEEKEAAELAREAEYEADDDAYYSDSSVLATAE